ncbi:DUF2971 domain-containing protein [Stenotrophomonas rhizophila]
MRLYYLTSSHFAISNIALKRVKVSRFSDLNDPFELLAVNLADKASRKYFREERERVNQERGLICLSADWKSPLMWGHYGDKHQGVALGFEVPADSVTEVLYKNSLAKVTLNLKKKPPAALIEELLRVKFVDWQYENEFRMFVGLEDMESEGGLYFKPFSKDFQLREVILGPRCSVSIAGVRNLVSTYKSKVDVIQARIAFTRFEVLKNRAASNADKLSS